MKESKTRLRGMRYTKAALLLFGFGLVLGFVVVVGEFSRLERVASVLMALSLALLPAALFADGHGMAILGWIAARLSREKRARPRAKSRPAGGRRKPTARKAARAPRRKR
jgi:hypothetical protein